MRNLKVRAWDEQNKVMHNNFQYISSGCADNDWVIFISDIHTLGNSETNPFTNTNPYFAMQLKKMEFIGTTDKNAVDIYEGDFVMCKHGWLGLVSYYNNRAHFACEEIVIKRVNSHGPIFEDWKELEVVGNIYENPEVLKTGEYYA